MPAQPPPINAPLVENKLDTVITSSVWRLWFQGLTSILTGVLNPPTTTSAPPAGGAGALPATPKGYMTVNINGVSRQIPYY